MKPKLICIEGPDGAGKTTLARMLYDYLDEIGYTALLAREPGGVHVSESIRTILKSPKYDVPERAEKYLFAAARVAFVEQFLENPKVTKGVDFIILDRYYPSTLALQTVSELPNDMEFNCGRRSDNRPARNVCDTYNELALLVHDCIGNNLPDIVCYCLPSDEVFLKRLSEREQGVDSLDDKGDTYHINVATMYELMAKDILDPIEHDNRIVDTSGTPEESFKLLLEALDHLL